MPFDEERYTLVRSDGSFEVLTQDKFNFSAGNTGLIIKGLGSNDTGARLMTTIKKSKVTEKVKRNNISGSVIIDKSTNPSSGTGSDTSNDGLTYGNYPFGTRVQDDSISLGVPDVQQIYAIYESEGTADPAIPSVVTSFLDGPTKTTDDLIVGELFIGATSGAIGFYFQKNTDVSIDFIARNKITFEEGEIVKFVKHLESRLRCLSH